MRSTVLSAALLAVMCCHASAQAGNAVLRVACDGEDSNAEVLIDNKFKGECPVDVKVPEGTVMLKAIKKVDELHERTFEQQIRLAEGTIKSVEVHLGPVELNAEGRRRETEARRQDEVLRAQQEAAAQAGDAHAMVAIGDRYAKGDSVNRDAQALDWYRKAADAGSDVGAFRVWSTKPRFVINFEPGAGAPPKQDDVADVIRMLSLPAPPLREVAIEGHDKVQEFIAADPFFAVEGGSQKLSYAHGVTLLIMDSRIPTALTTSCSGNGRLTAFTRRNKNQHVDQTGTWNAALGGLMRVSTKWSSGGPFSPDAKLELSRITWLQGQPFPLTAGRRFGFSTVTDRAKSTEYTVRQLACGVSGAPRRLAAQPAIAESVTSLVCWEQVTHKDRKNAQTLLEMGGIRRYYWHEPSSCFINLQQAE